MRSRQKSLVKTVVIGRAGLAYFLSTQIHKAKEKQRWNLIQEEVRASVEEERRSNMVDYPGRVYGRDKRTLWRGKKAGQRFVQVQGVYDVLLSPTNLFTWGKSEISSCPLYAGKGTLRHIMSACSRALGDGRYRWKHDQVLRTVADTVDAAIRANNFKLETKHLYYLKGGEYHSTSACKINSCLLSATWYRQLRVDIGDRLKVPEQIATTTLGPDLIHGSVEIRQVVLIELTVPWEEKIEVACKRKFDKY